MTGKEIVEIVHNALRESPLTLMDLEVVSGVPAGTFKQWFCLRSSPKVLSLIDVMESLELELAIVKGEMTLNYNDANELIKAIRDETLSSGMTISKLSKLSGVATSTIGNWFYMGVTPRLNALIDVVNALGMKLEVVKK